MPLDLSCLDHHGQRFAFGVGREFMRGEAVVCGGYLLIDPERGLSMPGEMTLATLRVEVWRAPFMRSQDGWGRIRTRYRWRFVLRSDLAEIRRRRLARLA